MHQTEGDQKPAACALLTAGRAGDVGAAGA